MRFPHPGTEVFPNMGRILGKGRLFRCLILCRLGLYCGSLRPRYRAGETVQGAGPCMTDALGRRLSLPKLFGTASGPQWVNSITPVHTCQVMIWKIFGIYPYSLFVRTELLYWPSQLSLQFSSVWPLVIKKQYHITHARSHVNASGLILGLRPVNERLRYTVTTSLIGWAQA